jgi:hypothetical protein
MGEKEILGFKHGEEQRLGQFVKYKYYAALETKCAALAAELKQSRIDADCYKKGMEASNARLVQLAAENAALKSGAMDEIKVINRGGQAYCVKDGVQVNPMYARGWNDYRAKSLQSDTPATDAFMAEVLAQGVEMFGQYHNFSEKLFIQKEAQKFAAQLRKGVDKK